MRDQGIRNRPGGRRGIGLPVAMVIVMFLYFVVTAVVAQSRYNLRLATHTDQSARDKYAAKGLVAAAIADLNLGNVSLEDLEGRSPGEGVAWAEEDPNNSSLYHVRGRIGQHTFTKIVRGSGGNLPMLFEMNGALGEITVFNGTDWEDVGLAPTFVYEDENDDGIPDLREGAHGDFDPSIHFQGAYADGNARLYMVYHPYDPEGLGGAPIILMAQRGGEDSWSWENVAQLPAQQNYRDLCVNDAGDVFHLLQENGTTVERWDGTELTEYELPENANAVRLQSPFTSLEESGPIAGGGESAEAYAETGSEIYPVGVGPVRALPVPSGATRPRFNPETGVYEPEYASFEDLRLGAGTSDGVSVFGRVTFESGDTRIMEYIMPNGAGTGSWGQTLRFGTNRQVENPETGELEHQLVEANVGDYDVDASGQPFVQYEEEGEQHLYHAVAGQISTAITGNLLAAGGAAPEAGESGGGTYTPLSSY